jgi:hypothetical protein
MHNCAEGFWIPKGREGWSWSRVVGELQQILAFLEEKEWQLVSKVPFSKGKHKGGIFPVASTR